MKKDSHIICCNEKCHIDIWEPRVYTRHFIKRCILKCFSYFYQSYCLSDCLTGFCPKGIFGDQEWLFSFLCNMEENINCRNNTVDFSRIFLCNNIFSIFLQKPTEFQRFSFTLLSGDCFYREIN